MHIPRVRTGIYIALWVYLTIVRPDSHISISLTPDIVDDSDGDFHCCKSRDAVDVKLNGLESEFASVYLHIQDVFKLVGYRLGCREDQREGNIDVDKLSLEMINVRLQEGHEIWRVGGCGSWFESSLVCRLAR